MSTENRASEDRASKREWLGLAVIALPCLLYSMDLTVLNLAVPSFAAALRPTGAELLWIIDVYGFFVAGSLITMGTLGDLVGRRRLLLFGAAAFGVMSVLAAFATTAASLIAARAALGLAGATLAPSTLSLIRNMFRDPAERRFAIGIWVSSYSAGTALGPVIGGLVLEHFWPGAVFLIGVPAMALLLLAGPFLLPESRDTEAGKLDLPSAGLSLVAALLVVGGLKWIADGNSGATSFACIAAGVVSGVLFLKRQPRLRVPLIELRLLRSPAFAVAFAAYGLSSFLGLGLYIFESQYLQLVLGLTPLGAGVWTVPFALAVIVGSLLTPALSRRAGPGVLLPSGLVLAAVGLVLVTRIQPSDGPVTLGVLMAVYTFGLSPVFTLSTDLMVGSVAPERAGSAAALSETSAELGGALGVAVLGSIGTFLYRRAMDGVPLAPASVDVGAARRTLGAALSIAKEIGGPEGSALSEHARTAFMHSFQTAAGIATVLALALALTTAIIFRRDREASHLVAVSDQAPT
jgi:DHA2 family multidrug resistance protein-like MFS transporter